MDKLSGQRRQTLVIRVVLQEISLNEDFKLTLLGKLHQLVQDILDSVGVHPEGRPGFLRGLPGWSRLRCPDDVDGQASSMECQLRTSLLGSRARRAGRRLFTQAWEARDGIEKAGSSGQDMVVRRVPEVVAGRHVHFPGLSGHSHHAGEDGSPLLLVPLEAAEPFEPPF
jgi:hypothetical protein